jgi:hypothetical protein
LRQRIIDSHPELRERELIKMASLAAAIAEALRGRGVTEPGASLAADSGIAVFRVAFERWLREKKKRDFAELIRESLQEFRAVTR